ncbi:MAG: biopolymer transporter ExbD [Phycisphaerales bacterium]|nr:biopolymer transporter ExbD [Phycisphaerales bacterium]
MSRRSGTSGHMLSVDLTPMIDVVFQLIIFFMFTSQFGEIRRSEIDLPREQGEEEPIPQQPAMIIDLTADGQYLFESKPMSLLEIERIAASGLASASDASPFDVLVRPDRNAPAVHLDRLLLRLSNVGVQRWKLATVEQGEQ